MGTCSPLREVAEPTKSGGADYTLALAGRAASVAACVVYVAVLSRLYLPSEIAVLAWLTAASALFEAGKGFGLATMLLRRLPGLAEGHGENSTEIQRWVRSYWWYTVAPLALLPLAGGVFGSRLMMAAGAAAAMQLAVNAHILVLQALRRRRRAAAAHLGVAVFHRLVPAVVAWLASMRLEGFLWLQTGAALILAVATMVCFRDAVRWSGPRLGWSEFWPESRFFYGAGILRCAAGQIDQVLVAALFPAPALATYYLARRLYSAAVVFIDAGVDVMLPQLSLQGARDPAGARVSQARILRVVMIVSAGVGVLTAANAPGAAAWLFGARYAEAAGLMPWLAAAAVAYAFYSLTVGAETVLGNPRTTLGWMPVAAGVPLLMVPAAAAALGVVALPLAAAMGYGMAALGVISAHTTVRRAALSAVFALAATTAVAAMSTGLRLLGLSPWAQTAGSNVLAAGSFVAAVTLAPNRRRAS